jgi:NDP-sugar pyrophosphorylase family protein
MQLKAAGVEEVILAVGHMAHLFKAFFQDGSRFGMKISYSYEDKPLGTAGALAYVLEDLGDDFIVMNGDLLTTLNFKQMFKTHQKRDAAATIATFNRKIKIDFGVIEFDSNKILKSYTEKPSYSFNLGMGVNILKADIVSRIIVKGDYLDMPELMLKIQQDGNSVYCHNEDCFWLDMGCHSDYQEANEVFESMKDQFLPNIT